MTKGTITFRLNSEKKQKLDSLATQLKRGRSYVMNEALDTYLEMHDWQIAHIEQSVKQADKKQFASEKDIQKAFEKWRST